MQYLIKLNNLEATIKFAQLIAKVIVPNFVVALSGDLGSGKTTLVRNILYSLGVTGGVKSPTYTVIEPYKVDDLDIYHFDLYRFSSGEEWLDSGFDEYLTPESICFIEWPEKAKEYIVIDWQITITVVDEVRCVTINSLTAKGTEYLSQIPRI